MSLITFIFKMTFIYVCKCTHAYKYVHVCTCASSICVKARGQFFGELNQVTKLGGKHLTIETSCRPPFIFENTCIWERGIPNTRCCQPLMEKAQTKEGCYTGVASIAPSFLLLASSETDQPRIQLLGQTTILPQLPQ